MKTISNLVIGLKFDGITLTQTVNVEKANVVQIDVAIDEHEIGARLNHENVLKVYQICIDKDFNGHILMDWADGGDMKSYIANNTNGINDGPNLNDPCKWLEDTIIKLNWSD